MALTPSTMTPLGSPAPDFRLPDPDGKMAALSDFREAPVLLVAFICNHCPYVQHLRVALAELARSFQARGVAVVAINSNDAVNYPEDNPAHMKEEAARFGYAFPYLFDDTQAVARAFRAACTPDFFVYGPDRKLTYRGQFDDSRPGNSHPVTGRDVRAALEAALVGKPAAQEQKPSMGCNIKWKAGAHPRS